MMADPVKAPAVVPPGGPGANPGAESMMMITKEDEAITKDDLQAMKDMIGDIKKDPSLLYRLSSLPGGGGSGVGGGDPSSAPINNFATANGRNTSAAKIFVDDDATDVSSLGMMSSSDYNGGSNHSFGGGAVDPMSPNIKIHAGMNPSSFASAAANAVVRRTNHDAEIALRMQSLRAKRGLLPSVPTHQGASQPRMGGGHVHHSPMKSGPPACEKPTLAAGAEALTSAQSNATLGAPALNGKKNLSGAALTPAAAASAAILHQSKKAPPRGGVGPVLASATGRWSDPGTMRQMASPRQQQQQQQRRMQKKLEGRRSSHDEGSIKSGRSSRSSRRECNQETARSVKSDGSENSVALVLYEGENANQSLEPVGKNDNINVSKEALALSSGVGCTNVRPNNCLRSQQPLPAAQYYHSAVSKYGAEETSPAHNNMKGGQNGEAATTQQRRSTRDKLSSSSVRRSKIEGKINPDSRGAQNSEVQRVSAPVSKRSRSELPRKRSSRDKLRSSSVQPSNREPSRRLQQHGHHSLTRSRSSRRQKIFGDPPSLAARAKNVGPVLDRDSLIANLRAEQQQSSAVLSNDTEREAKEKKKKKESAVLSHEKGSRHSPKHRSNSPPGNERNKSPVASKGREQTHAATDGEGETKNGSYKRGGGDEVGVLPKDRMIEPDDGNQASENRSRHSNGGFKVDKKCDSLMPPSGHTLGHGLAELSGTDRSGMPRRRPSVDSESGRSVISRLSNLRRVKGKAPSKRSVSSHDNIVQGSTYSEYAIIKQPGSDSSDHCHHNHGGHPRDHKLKGGLVSRISQNFGGSSPKVMALRRMSEANESIGRKPGHDDDISSSGRLRQVSYSEDHLYIADEDEPDHVALGIELAMRSGEVPRLCDERGRCLFHPHIRLQKPRLFGGWKILFKHCPDCAVEHMKRTQEKLASIQRQRQAQKERGQRERERERERQQRGQQKKTRKKSHRKEKEREKIKADPIIGKNVGNEDLAVEQNKVKKRSHHNRKKEKEKLKEKSREESAITKASPSRIASSSEDPAMKKNRPPPHHHQNMDQVQNQQQQLDIVDEKKSHDNECDKPYQPQAAKQHQQQPTPPPLQVAEPSSLALVDYKPKPKTKTKTKKRVNGLPWSDYNGHSGRYTGEVNEQYLPHGQGEMVYDRGIVSAGVWFNGVLDTEGGMEDEGNRYVGLSEEQYTPDSLPNYAIGDKGRDEDMVVDSKKVTATVVAELRVNDAAFVRRSDGSWTYAVVKDRTHGGEDNQTIRFKVNLRGSTKAFPTSQWGTYVRRIKRRAPDAPAPKHSTLGDFLDSKKVAITAAPGSSNSVSANLMRGIHIGDAASVSSVHSAPMRMRRSTDNLTTGKMKIRTRSRSRSRNRKNVTTLPLLFSSSMSVSEENDEGQNNDDWETASGSGYRLRGIDP